MDSWLWAVIASGVLALLYGASGQTDLAGIAKALGPGGQGDDVMALTGMALVVGGLGFKAAIAPFQQWTPDVYEGAPTPITAFMAVATKAAAFGVFLRFFDVALIGSSLDWAPVLALLAAVTIVVGAICTGSGSRFPSSSYTLHAIPCDVSPT